MLLTGFDAPVEQVMYLDSPLKEHTLLQAIARVNRVHDDKKTYGLIVDYWGVSEALQEALAIFAPSDVKGAMAPKGDELPRLQARHAAMAMRFFVRVKDQGRPRRVRRRARARGRARGVRRGVPAVRRSRWTCCCPRPRALCRTSTMRWLGKIRAAARAKYRDEKLDISDCGAKVRELIEDAVIADGIQILVKQVSLFSPEFEEKLKALRTEEARASEMEHAIKNEIHVKFEEDPAFYSSLRERLESLIEERKAKRLDAAQQLKLLEAFRTELRGHNELAESLGMSETSFAIYGLIVEPRAMSLAEPRGVGYVARLDESKKELAELLEEHLAPQVGIVDWTTKDDVLREMRRLIKRQLKVASVPEEKRETIAESIVDLMKRRRGR